MEQRPRPRLAPQSATWLGSSTAPVRRVAPDASFTQWGRRPQKKDEVVLLRNSKSHNRGLVEHKDTLAWWLGADAQRAAGGGLPRLLPYCACGEAESP